MKCKAFEVHLWGVSRGSKRNAVERVEMSIHVGEEKSIFFRKWNVKSIPETLRR